MDKFLKRSAQGAPSLFQTDIDAGNNSNSSDNSDVDEVDHVPLTLVYLKDCVM